VSARVKRLRARLNEHGLSQETLSELAAVWPDLIGAGETKMGSSKLARAEDVRWDDPELRFTIERHGATVLGSSRANLQGWVVDLQAGTATASPQGYRQLRRTAARFTSADAAALAVELAEAMQTGAAHPLLEWITERRARVRMSDIVGSGPKQTVEARTRRMRQALKKAIEAVGWQYDGRGVYSQIENP
jgi:hypothetical protein